MAFSLRINSLRIDREHFLEAMSKYNIKEVEWYKDAYTTDFPSISRTIEYQLGYFYIQSLSSMVPVQVLSPKPGDRVLDLAAAPGSKATQCAMHMQDDGIIIANDVSYMRLKSLASHIDRLGITSIALTNYDGRTFPKSITFDKILLDAPCSSMGSRKNVMQHSEGRIRSLSRLQKSLLLRAVDLLSPGGTLVYSTCTTTVEENEEVIRYLLDKRNDISIERPELPFSISQGASGDSSVDPHVCRFTLDEAFFIAKIKRE